MKLKILLKSGLILLPLLSLCLMLNIWGIGNEMSLKEETTVAFVNANVIPMNSERILKNHTVIVKNGLIESDRLYRADRGRCESLN